MEIALFVAPSNGTVSRTIAAKTATVEHYDCFNPFDAFRRGKFIDTLATKLHAARGDLNGLDDEIIREANRADEQADVGKCEISYQRITWEQLDSGDYDEEYLIDGVLVAGQPCIVGGPRKGLKTCVMADLAISLATGTPFLGRFEVSRAVRTAIMSGESGLSTLQKTARAIGIQKGVCPTDTDNLIWSPDLPKIGHMLHMDALAKFLRNDGIEVAIFDPAYLMMPATDSGNLFAQGELLRSITDVCKGEGAMMTLAHHNTKVSAQSFEEPSLDWLSWSGFAEFGRQWILLGRRAKYQPGSGFHEMWLSFGGSAGHSSLWGLNIDEGQYPNRHWQPTLMRPEEVRENVHEAIDAAKDAKKREDMERDKSAILRATAALKDKQGTQTDIKVRCGRNTQRFNAAFAELVDEGSLVEVEITKGNNRKYAGWKLKPDNP